MKYATPGPPPSSDGRVDLLDHASPAEPPARGVNSEVGRVPTADTASIAPLAGVAEPRDLFGRAVGLALRNRCPGLVIIHAVLFGAIYLMAFLIRFDGAIPPEYFAQARLTAPIVVGIKIAIFLALGCHRGWWRFVSFADVTALAEASALCSLVLLILGRFGDFEPAIPRSVPILDGAATLLVLGGVRGATRLLRERYYPIIRAGGSDRALVVGADEAGIALVQQVQRQPGLRMRVVGLLDDSPGVQGRTMGGVRVVGAIGDLCRLAALHQARTVLIPTPAIPARVVRQIASVGTQAGLKVQVVPGFDALLSGKLVARPRDVQIQDLLARDPVRLDGDSIDRLIRGRVVLVTGAAGSIGSEICRQVLSFEPEHLVLLDFSENGLFFLEREIRALGCRAKLDAQVASIGDRARLRATFARFRPTIVFHAAAHKHVPMMEANPGEAVKNNVMGTRNVVEEAIRAGVERFVLISTDKAVNPTSVMGACKRLAEMYLTARSAETTTQLVSVRFGNVLGSNGSVIPIFQGQIRNGGPITVTHPDMTRYFMTILEAAQLVLQAGALGVGGEIFVLDMGEPIRILDLARSMARLSGLDDGREIEIVFTGLRPGEKLHEELRGQGEEYLPTSHPKVFAIKQSPISADRLRGDLDRLTRVVEDPAEEVLAALVAIIPEFRRGEVDRASAPPEGLLTPTTGLVGWVPGGPIQMRA